LHWHHIWAPVETTGALERADKSNDPENLRVFHPRGRRHVAETPVMRPDTLLGRRKKGDVAGMARFVDDVF
jgi:hypothetical protein